MVAALWAKVRKIPVVEAATKSSEKVLQSLSRKEHFKPFDEGKAEWQYVTFQYDNDKNERLGITVSMSELIDPDTGDKKHQLLVMRHNLQTKKTQKRTYTGVRLFDENTSTYAFMDGDNQLAEFSYNEGDDKYRIQVHTDEFDSNEINSGGLVLNPQGDLIPVSKDGNFTVASFEGGGIDTNYFADHIRVETPEGEILGYGRRDSENLVLKGSVPCNQLILITLGFMFQVFWEMEKEFILRLGRVKQVEIINLRMLW